METRGKIARLRAWHRLSFAQVVAGIAFFCIYYFTAKLGLSFSPVGKVATAIWVPTGLSLAALILLGIRLWPAVAIAAFFVNYSATGSLLASCGIAAGNTLEAVIGAFLVQRITPNFGRVKDVIAFILLAAVLSTLTSATIGVVSSWLAGIVATSDFWMAWRVWWVGDILSNLVIAPTILVWHSVSRMRWTIWKVAEGAAFLAILFGLNILIFGSWRAELIARYVMPYWVFPMLLWATMRFLQWGAVTATLVVAFVATWGTVNGLGPFTEAALVHNLLSLQTFMGLVAVTNLVFGALVSERRTSETQLRETLATLERERDVRDRFVSTLTHDLRTPLTAAKMSSQLIARQAGREGAVPGLAAKICDNIDRADRMIQDLLDANRIRAGLKVNVEFTEFDLRELVEGALDDLTLLYGDRFLVRAEGELRGCWSRQGLRRILENLCSNAVKYGRSGSKVTILLKGTPGEVSLAVRNVGDPIPAREVQRLFETFQRGSGVEASGKKGWGIGLTIIRGIAESHGGRVMVESGEDGTTFTVSLPRDASEFLGIEKLPNEPVEISQSVS